MATFTKEAMDLTTQDQQVQSSSQNQTNQTIETQTTGSETMKTPMTQTTEKMKWLKVELYEVEEGETMDRLDALEWHPRWYVRTPVKTKDGDIVETYNMPLNRNEGIDSEEYLAIQLESEDDKNLFYNWNR